MNSNLPPIRKAGPGPIAPKPKNIKIQAGRDISNTSNAAADTTPIYRAKLVDNSNNNSSRKIDTMNKRHSPTIDLPLPPSPNTLSTFILPKQEVKATTDNDKPRFKFIFPDDDDLYMNSTNNKNKPHAPSSNTTINVSSDASSSPTITITARNGTSNNSRNIPIYDNNESKTYNIPIQHMPSTRPKANANGTANKSLNDQQAISDSINDLLALSNRNGELMKQNNNNVAVSKNSNADDEVDVLKDLLMKNLLGSQDPSFEGICGKCGESIIGDVGLKAMDQLFHAKCFNCAVCNYSIKDKHFYVMDNKAYCEGCYMRLLERCNVCSRPITDRILRATGKPFHPECFCCVLCKNNLDGVPFTVDAANKIHCIDCFHNKYAPRCHICRLPITPEPGEEETTRIVALDKSFHIGCYKCEDCGVSLSSNSERVGGCYPLDDHIYCKMCNIQKIRNLKGMTPTGSPVVSARQTDL